MEKIAQTEEYTVVEDYTPEIKTRKNYQNEAELEQDFIQSLINQGYEYLKIKNENDLVANLKTQIERLNGIKFSQDEWESFYKKLVNANNGVIEKTRIVQEDHIQIAKIGESEKNIKLFDKKNLQNNFLQVINQYKANAKNRYDVTILVNGFPLVHIELKRRGVSLKEAFNQIKRYSNESFGGLFEFVQIFVISNGTISKYYSNSARKNQVDTNNKKVKMDSFEFTNFWADANNRNITDLIDFTKTFFARHTILAVLFKYCVFNSENSLLVMRPYQIVACERILNKIECAKNAKIFTSRVKLNEIPKNGGYIWHSTGSGKTLTSFKVAKLASKLDFVDKVLFVVDRKDLDYQTIKEYDKFQKGAANGNTSTKELSLQLQNDNAKIIITTIQKLSNFIKKSEKNEIYSKYFILIFDECHRSQFGEMHKLIVSKFQKFNIFGFTGTPIFAKNSGRKFLTTQNLFGTCLHTYTLVDAIKDRNVLPFKVDYVRTFKASEEIEDKEVEDIDKQGILNANERINLITKYILDHFENKTKRSSFYEFKGKKMSGFNSIFACSSIESLKLFYNEFKRQIKERNSEIFVATIFSFSQNEGENDGINDENFEPNFLDYNQKEFLSFAMKDYNAKFGTNFDINTFENYYKDISARTKNKEIDILLVVNMFLTGFDAKTLNTLWVDKWLRYHGLLQAFSRTNRILNDVKTHGNIVCFRNLNNELSEAIKLFNNKNAKSVIILKTFSEYMNGYEENGKKFIGYKDLISRLLSEFPLENEIIGEKNEKEFISLFGSILRAENILSVFDEFDEEAKILTGLEMQDYQSRYLDLLDKYRDRHDKENIKDDIVFEIELISQIEVNIDYILEKIKEYFDKNKVDENIKIEIKKAVESSISLRSKRDLIYEFIDQIDELIFGIDESFYKFSQIRYKKELSEIIKTENLKEKKTNEFMKTCFLNGEFKSFGGDLSEILPAVSMFGGGENLVDKKTRVSEILEDFFEKFSGLVSFKD